MARHITEGEAGRAAGEAAGRLMARVLVIERRRQRRHYAALWVAVAVGWALAVFL